MSRSKKRSRQRQPTAVEQSPPKTTPAISEATSTSPSFPTRELSCLWTTRATWECAQSGNEGFCCIPCAYKVGCFDVALDTHVTTTVPNQRPEACPRVAAAHQKDLERHKDESTSSNMASLNQHMHHKPTTIVEKQSTTSSVGALGYGPGMNVLTVGDGDFSFSLAIARMMQQDEPSSSNSSSKPPSSTKMSRLLVTSYETHETLERVYQKAFHNTLKELQELHESSKNGLDITILYQVDATKLQSNNEIIDALKSSTSDATAAADDDEEKQLLDRIVWNFPCSAISQGQDGQNAEMEENKALVASFVQQAQCLLHPLAGQIHMNHKTKPPFDQWHMPEIALSKVNDETSATSNTTTTSSSNMHYWGRVVWDRALFPPYVPRKALHSKSFPCHDACTYVFTTANTRKTSPTGSDSNQNDDDENTISSCFIAPWSILPQAHKEKQDDNTNPDNISDDQNTRALVGHELVPVTQEMIGGLRDRLFQQVSSRALWNARRRGRSKKKAKRGE